MQNHVFNTQLPNLKASKELVMWKLYLHGVFLVFLVVMVPALVFSLRISNAPDILLPLIFLLIVIYVIANLVLGIMSINKVVGLSHEFKKLVFKNNILLTWLVLAIFLGIIFDILFLVSVGSAIRKGEAVLQTQTTKVDFSVNTPLDSVSHS